MSKILVWKSYGDIRVYLAEEPEDLIKIINTVFSCIQGWDLDDVIEKCKVHMAKVGLDRKELLCVIDKLIYVINPSYDNDSFQDFFITELKSIS